MDKEEREKLERVRIKPFNELLDAFFERERKESGKE